MCFSSSNAGDVGRQQQQQQQLLINTGLGQIDTAFQGFTPGFYKARANAYTQAALPQFQQQYQNQLGNLMFRLGNQGLLKSSAGRTLGNALSNYANIQKANIASQGIAASQDLRRQVEQTRSNLVSQLEASADPTSAAQQATSMAASFAAPSPLPAIGNLFSDWANIYGTQRQTAAIQPFIGRGLGLAPAGSSEAVIK